MAKKHLKGSNPFEQMEAESLQDRASNLYGSSPISTRKGKQIARPVDIHAVFPDRMQPRRVIPSMVREVGASVRQSIIHWVDLARAERGDDLSAEAYWQGIQAMLEHDPAAESLRQERSGPLESGLFMLTELAASIHAEGLTNPITVAKDGELFIIETGERRWLAYHLLDMVFGEDGSGTEPIQWTEIPSRIVDEFSVWRQAAENNARANLNAISRARQLALLLMDLHGMQHFRPIDAFQHERDFYAQVADGNAWGIPRGKGEALLNAMGLKNGVQLRQYRGLLRLPHEAWAIADDASISERRIRQVMTDAINDEDLVKLMHDAALEFGDGDDSVTMVTVTPENPPKRQPSGSSVSFGLDPAMRSGKRLFPKQQEKEVREIMRVLGAMRSGVSEANPSAKAVIREWADKVRSLLDEVEGHL